MQFGYFPNSYYKGADSRLPATEKLEKFCRTRNGLAKRHQLCTSRVKTLQTSLETEEAKHIARSALACFFATPGHLIGQFYRSGSLKSLQQKCSEIIYTDAQHCQELVQSGVDIAVTNGESSDSYTQLMVLASVIEAHTRIFTESFEDWEKHYKIFMQDIRPPENTGYNIGQWRDLIEATNIFIQKTDSLLKPLNNMPAPPALKEEMRLLFHDLVDAFHFPDQTAYAFRSPELPHIFSDLNNHCEDIAKRYLDLGIHIRLYLGAARDSVLENLMYSEPDIARIVHYTRIPLQKWHDSYKP